MKKYLFYLQLMLSVFILLGGCTQLGNTATSAPVELPTNHPTHIMEVVPTRIFTPIPTPQQAEITPDPTAQPSVTASTAAATPSQAAPTNTSSSILPTSTPAGQAASTCTNTAGFFGDVTIPDGTSFAQNVSFVKTWAIRNEGTCSWGADYSLVFYGGDQMSGPLSIPFSAAAPGDIMNISVNLKSPAAGGSFTGLWEFQDPSGKRFGVNSGGVDPIWVKIGVTIFNQVGEIVPVGATPLPAMVAANNAPQNPTTVVSNTATPEVSVTPLDDSSPNSTATAINKATSTPSNTCSPQENSDDEQQILGLINNARAQNNLYPLKLNNKLSAAAYLHSSDMACNNYVDHTGSDGSTWFTRIQAEKYTYSYASENIYVGNPAFGGTPQGAFTWWMNSQIHRDNILSIKVSDIGIGYAFYQASDYGGYYTLDFAKP
ncbi:MAG: NBR1-Ig-like domain-containing protein [Anaerolineaceae bacterium]|nr:NBR1-Ig-like domain-containing protein [Anaerolineaceae bacterium]